MFRRMTAQTPNILIVDDDADIRNLLADYLGRTAV